MNKTRITKMLIKAAIGGVTAVMIGATIKQEKRVAELLDAHFDTTTTIQS